MEFLGAVGVGGIIGGILGLIMTSQYVIHGGNFFHPGPNNPFSVHCCIFSQVMHILCLGNLYETSKTVEIWHFVILTMSC